MNRRLLAVAFAAPLFTILALLPRTSRASSNPDTLADSTSVERWTLANGLQVSLRSIPRCRTVAMALAFRVGRDVDPRGREGVADLAAEVLLTGATGSAPERSRGQLDSIRPLGWNLQVSPRFTLITENATAAQAPIVLADLAARLRGVTVTDSVVAQSLRTVRVDQAQMHMAAPDLTLYNRLRIVATGVSEEELLRRVSGRTLQGIKPAEIRDRLRRFYVPANAVLALAGGLDRIDAHALVRQLFEDIPGGTRASDAPFPPLTASARAIRRVGVRQPLGAVAVIGPALTDSLSPTFYLNALLIGRYVEEAWGSPPAEAPLRYKISILSDPQIAQYFPPIAANETDADQTGVAFQDAIEKLAVTIIPPNTLDDLRNTHAWILGGPMHPDLTQLMRQQPATLATLASTLAMRALWGDEAFWRRYRERFMDQDASGGEHWTDYFEAPEHIVRLLITPARNSPAAR